MAVKKVNTDEPVEAVIVVKQEPVEEVTEVVETQPEPEVLMVTEEVFKERTVRVKPNATYNTSIGGTYYCFVKDECQNVPENVKRIMTEGGMLQAL